VQGNTLDFLAISSNFRQECTISVQIYGQNESVLEGRFWLDFYGWLGIGVQNVKNTIVFNIC